MPMTDPQHELLVAEQSVEAIISCGQRSVLMPQQGTRCRVEALSTDQQLVRRVSVLFHRSEVPLGRMLCFSLGGRFAGLAESAACPQCPPCRAASGTVPVRCSRPVLLMQDQH